MSIGEWNLETLKLKETVAYHMRGQEGVMKWEILSA
jgi:hypothetical protein